MLKKNITSLIFAFVFLAIALSRWNDTQAIDHLFYSLAVVGFLLLWLFSNLKNKKD